MMARKHKEGYATKYYCRAISNLTRSIVSVLQHERSALEMAHSYGLIEEDAYSMEDSAEQARELLRVTQSRIRIQSSIYHTFLKFLRSIKSSKHLADMVEKEVSDLKARNPIGSQRKKMSKKRVKMSGKEFKINQA